MRKIVRLFVPVFILLSLSCGKKKTTQKIDGSWTVTILENKYYSAENVGTCEFKSGGTGAYNLSFFNPLEGKQIINTETFKWSNSKSTLSIQFDSNGARIYYKIEHLSAKMLKINSGDVTYAILTMSRP